MTSLVILPVWVSSLKYGEPSSTLAQVFPCEFCEIFKNTFFTEHLRWLLLYHSEAYPGLSQTLKCRIALCNIGSGFYRRDK